MTKILNNSIRWVAILLASACLTGTSVASHGPKALVGDAYIAYMKETLQEVHMLYMKTMDEKATQGEAEKARQSALRKTREALGHMHRRFSSLEIEQGAAMSAGEMLLNTHLMSMTIDLLAAEHLPHVDKWSYTE